MDKDITEKKRRTGSFHVEITVLIVTIMLLLLVIQGYFQNNAKKDGAERSAEILLTKVQDIIENNEEDEEKMIASLKEDYIIRAKAASYMVEKDAGVEQDIKELKKIAGFLQVDELHLFDSAGVIYGGTNPEYYGYSFDSGEQMSFFKPMLADKAMSLCQDVTPNTAEGKEMMYALVWREDGKGLVQIGVKPTRLLEEMHNNEISSLAANMPIAEDMTIYIADRNSGTILGSTQERLVNRNLSEIGIDPDSRNIEKSALFTCSVLGEATYCLFQECGDYQIGVTQLCSEVNKEFWNEMLILSAYLGTAAAVLILVIWKSTDLIEKEREERLKEQKTQNQRLSDALNHAEVANKAKTTFLFDISHDIRTPMNAILGYTRLAQNHLTDMKSLERYLNNIAVSGEQLLGLINSVLDMSRIESGKVILDEKSYSVYDIIDELHMSVKGEMEKKHISFDMVRDYPDQDIFCDRVKVQEIFLNLLSNAIKYNREGGI